jgi:hypothetical protein
MFVRHFGLRRIDERGKCDAKEHNHRERFHRCNLRGADRRETRVLD